MNKKAEMNWMLVSVTVAVVGILIFGSFAIFSKTTKLTEWIEKNIGVSFGLEETTTTPIDEERIDKKTLITIDTLDYDKESGSWIEKQGYGQGWNLYKTVLEVQAVGPGFTGQQSQVSKTETLLENQALEIILNSDKLHGKIKVNEKTYVHTNLYNNFCWFVATNSDFTYYGEYYNDNNKNCQKDADEPFTDSNNNNQYDAGEIITAKDLAQLIISDLFQDAEEESS